MSRKTHAPCGRKIKYGFEGSMKTALLMAKEDIADRKFMESSVSLIMY